MKEKLLVFIVFVVTLLVVGQVVFGGNYGIPGSEEDPVITKSYIEETLVPRLEEEFKEMLTGEVDEEKAEEIGVSEKLGNFEIVELEEGESLVAGHSAEIIARTGEGSIIDSPAGGISDLTEAQDLREGETVPLNHLLLVPRDDGRGIKVESYMIIMIRGEYQVELN